MAEPDGSLVPWPDLAGEYDWQALLLGNGLSIHVWEPFDYPSLYEQARGTGLTAEDEALFGLHGGTNFERVLADLRVAIQVSEVLGTDRSAMEARYRSIQQALGRAIREVHLPRQEVPDRCLQGIREVLASQQVVFTTSYDLIIYWAMGYGETFEPFVDLFLGRPCRFSPFLVEAHQVPVYYLHGALHLVIEGSGQTQKLRWGDRTLLEQFGEPIPGDPEAHPLLVTEGTSADKLATIDDNAYLSHALDRLREWALPIAVFGSSLRAQDDHLVAALNENGSRPVAVSMRPNASRRELRRKQDDIYYRLNAEPLVFFDATTHPSAERNCEPPDADASLFRMSAATLTLVRWQPSPRPHDTSGRARRADGMSSAKGIAAPVPMPPPRRRPSIGLATSSRIKAGARSAS
jgi:hypothetical protein